MPRIPDELLDRVKREIPITTLVTRAGVELRRVGTNLQGRCNRHVDDTASLSVSEDKNLWHCLGACQRGGSVVDWVMWQEDLPFAVAARRLVEEFFPEEARALVVSRPSRRFRAEPLPSPIDEEGEEQETDRQVVAYYHETGKESPELHAYLEKRAIASAELVDRFRLGFSNRTLGLRLTPRLRKRCQALGWIRETGHEHLRGSLTVPVFGASGEVLNCYGRKIRDDLRTGTPDHLYLSRPLRGLLNREAFQASGEIVLCEAPIDLLSAFRHGYRNATCTWGAEGFTEDHLEAFVTHGVERCLIAFDRDAAGDEGARKVAAKLGAAGIACYRVLFPKGMDVNDVVVKMHPADKTLGVFFRSAEWMSGGNGRKSLLLGSPPHAPSEPGARPSAPVNGHELSSSAALASLLTSAIPAKTEESPSAGAAPAAPGPPEAAEHESRGAAEDESREAAQEKSPEATDEKSLPAAEEGSLTSPPKVAVPPAPTLTSTPAPSPSWRTPDPLVSTTEDEAVFLFGDRRYRVRGLARNTAFGVLKLNVLCTREDVSFEGTPLSGLHADTFDLYLARSRQLFERQAAQEMSVEETAVKRDLCSMLRRLEEIQAEAVRKAHEPRALAVVLSEEETREAMALWRSPDLLSRIVEDMTACGLVGETTNKLVTYIAAVSRLLERPLAVVIQSSSAAGKTSLMEAVLALMPAEAREKYTAVSGRSLFYFDETTSLRHKILAVVEEEGAERATYPLKLLQSEGELVMASTGKDPHTGKLVTQVYRVEGPVMIILTTTAIELDPELENRCLRLTVDESREQTRLIHELQRKRQTLEGLRARKQKERIQTLHQNAQRLLRPVKVLNPYVNALTFVDDQTRTRRDHDKYLTLIEAIALLHQHQRKLVHVLVEGEAVECVTVELSDIRTANRLAGEVLGRTLDELPPQTRRFLTILRDRVRAACQEQAIGQEDLRFSRRDLRAWTGWGDFPVRVHLGRLVELEYVLVHRGGRGQSFVYELLYRGEGLDGQPFVLGLVDAEKLARKDEEDPTTTRTSMGEDPGVDGPLMALRGPSDGPSSPPKTTTKPAPGTAFRDFEGEEPENARLPAVPKTASYRTRTYRLRPYAPPPPRPGMKLNLLRFPPGSLPSERERPLELASGL